MSALVEEAVTVGDLVRLFTFRQGNANLVEMTLPEDSPYVGKPAGLIPFPENCALVTILRDGQVYMPDAEQPIEAGDELLFVVAADVEDELERPARPRHARAGLSRSAVQADCGGLARPGVLVAGRAARPSRPARPAAAASPCAILATPRTATRRRRPSRRTWPASQIGRLDDHPQDAGRDQHPGQLRAQPHDLPVAGARRSGRR